MKTRDSVPTLWGLSGVRLAMGQYATQCTQRVQRTRTNEATTPTANDVSCARCGTIIPIADQECRKTRRCTHEEQGQLTTNANAHEAHPKPLGLQTQHRVVLAPLSRLSRGVTRIPEHASERRKESQKRKHGAFLDGRSAILSSVATRTIHASICNFAISIHCRWMSWAWS